MSITVKKMSPGEFLSLGVEYWPIWEKDISTFNWEYPAKEEFYIVEGRALVETPEGEISIGVGDFVTCSKDMVCNWRVLEYFKKHYHFVED